MTLRTAVHKGGVATFPTLPSDSYAYQIDFEQHEGRVWLKSDRTAREWECVFNNYAAFAQNPVFRDQFMMEMTLLELALHHDPRVHNTDACNNVILTRSGDDLVMQLSERVYTRRNPNWGPTIHFTLEWVRGSGNLPYAPSRDPPEPIEPPKPRVPREEQQKEILVRLRDENKALKTAKRERASEMRQWKTENDTLRRENQQLKQANDTQYAQLIKLGGSHEFQRQHIEHLRRKIQALEKQVTQATGGQQQQVSDGTEDDAVVVEGEADEVEEQQPTDAEAEADTGAATEQNKRRRTSKD